VNACKTCPYFLIIPVFVLERLFTAPLAAGELTAFPEDNGELVPGFVCVAPIVFPEEPRLRALAVLGVFEPPMPFAVLPPESEPLEALPEEEPPDVCANEEDETSAKQVKRPMTENFIAFLKVQN
jgi:hypothetical protein